MSEAARQSVVWLGMGLEVPAQWEIARHSTNPKGGSLIWVDRRSQRLQLSWRDCPRTPDLRRMIEDYRCHDLAKHADAKFTELTAAAAAGGAWAAVRRQHAGANLTRALRYESERRLLIETVFPWPGEMESEMERMVLASFALVGMKEGQATPWRAFGIDAAAPWPWEIKAAQVRPGEAVLTFGRGGDRAVLRRRGVPEAWYDGRPQSLLLEELGGRPMEMGREVYRGHDACRGRSRAADKPWVRLLGRSRRREDLIWLCPNEQAVYQVTLWCRTGRKADVTAPEAFGVRCCTGMEQA